MRIPPIISVDDHVLEPPDLWQRWLPEHLRESGPRVVRLPWEWGTGFRQKFLPASSGPEADFWIFGDLVQGILNGAAAVGLSSEEIDGTPISFDQMRPGFFRPAERLVDMDVVDAERSMCFPNASRFAGQMFLWMADRELARASVHAYNDWMVEEWCGDSGGRLIPLCMIPLWDPQEAAAEVRRNAARGVRAVTFTELPSELGLPSIHDASGHWLPFLQACEETGTVVCIHIGSSSTVAATSEDAPMGVTLGVTGPHSSVHSL